MCDFVRQATADNGLGRLRTLLDVAPFKTVAYFVISVHACVCVCEAECVAFSGL